MEQVMLLLTIGELGIVGEQGGENQVMQDYSEILLIKRKAFVDFVGRLFILFDSFIRFIYCLNFTYYNINQLIEGTFCLLSMGKLLKSLALVGGVIYVIPPLRHHFDQKIFKHVRNYNTTLNQRNRFNTEEEFHDFLGNLGNGLVTFFDTKYWLAK